MAPFTVSAWNQLSLTYLFSLHTQYYNSQPSTLGATYRASHLLILLNRFTAPCSTMHLKIDFINIFNTNIRLKYALTAAPVLVCFVRFYYI